MIKKLFFISLATLLIIFKPCFGMQKEGDDDWVTIDHKDLKTIFHENKEFFEKRYKEPEVTSQNINLLLYKAAVDNENYDLVIEIVNAMQNIIENYKELYAAIRAGKKGLTKLQKLLKEGVIPHGYAQPGHDGTIQYVCRTNVEEPPSFYSAEKNKVVKEIYLFLKEKGFEESSPLSLAVKLKNKKAAEILADYGARRPSKAIVYGLGLA
jgi:hypothetical protein